MRTLPESIRLKSPGPALFATLAAAAVILALATIITDLGGWDETSYMTRGEAFLTTKPLADFAPLYSLFYWLLDQATQTPVALYYAGFFVVELLLVASFYATLRGLSLAPVTAGLLALCLINIAGRFQPRPGHLALAIVLAALCLARRRPNALHGCILLGGAATIAAYMRPEFALTALLIAALTLVLLGRAIRGDGAGRLRLELILLAVWVVGAAALLMMLGNPLGARSVTAFGSHFALHYLAWTGSGVERWMNWQPIYRDVFHDAPGLFKAFETAPAMFLRHVLANLAEFPARFAALLLGYGVDYVPKSRGMILLGGVTGGAVLLAAIVTLPRRVTFRPRLSWPLLACLAAFILPGVISVAVIYPHFHYMLPLCVFCLVFALATLQPRRDQPAPKLLLAALAAYLVFYLTAIGWDAGRVVRGDAEFAAVNLPHRTLVTAIEGLGVTAPVGLLEDVGGIAAYLPANFQWVSGEYKAEPFDDYAAHRSVNMIVLDPLLLGDQRFADDPQWRRMLEDPEQAGWRMIAVPHSDFRLLIRPALLPATWRVDLAS
ncbi:MAG: hypothetical protein QOJ54_3506 [Aliidongia sp.]|nr:hypothetical protein [Aliidongia sp.]